jgi:hypothetical protein
MVAVVFQALRAQETLELEVARVFERTRSFDAHQFTKGWI